jgi:ribosome-associated protein
MTPEEMKACIIEELDNLKAHDILSIDVSSMTTITDHMVICTATSGRHANALLSKLQEALKTKGLNPHVTDSKRDPSWLIVDYADVIVHIMQADKRAFYSLEKLWFHEDNIAMAASS